MELKDFHFPTDLTGEIRTLSSQMQSTPEETIYMCLFKGQLSHLSRKPITTQQYARIVKRWLKNLLGIEDVDRYSTHSLRKTKPTVIYDRTKNVDAVRRLLGQSSITATSEYLGVTDNASLDLARTINI